MARTAGPAQAAGGIRMLCLCMKSCGGIASVVAGGTKVWMRRNGHRGGMESSFREGDMHTHALVFTLGRKLHDDTFQRSRWAHQSLGRVFTLDFFSPKSIHMCTLCAVSWYVRSVRVCQELNSYFKHFCKVCLSSGSACLRFDGPTAGVTWLPPTSHFWLKTVNSPCPQLCTGTGSYCNQNSQENGILYMQNKQCGGNKTFRRAVRSFQESIRGLSSASQPLPGNYAAYFMSPIFSHTGLLTNMYYSNTHNTYIETQRRPGKILLWKVRLTFAVLKWACVLLTVCTVKQRWRSDGLIRIKVSAVTDWHALEQNHP